MAAGTLTQPSLWPALRRLIGAPCWGVVAGAGTGSLVSIHFGRKLRLGRPSSNTTLEVELQHYEGEFILYVECAWELRRKGKLLCSSHDDNRRGGRMERGLKQMVGQKVHDVNVGIATLDLTLKLEEDLAFQVLCDQEKVEPSDDNYTIFVPGIAYTVGARGKLREERQANGFARRSKNGTRRGSA